ncbi:pyrimidine dimer DNA glycosylase/endonuclease V [Kerstersia similis]|uniref:pyrimidine dimer DNA glycosylase/endonuclease V n=1 Tax=Kerstersia similis TaxID=206505 RepID=UPI0039EF975A
MTRINCVPVEELTQQHLVAEYRELPRVFGLARKARERDDPRRQNRYVLGAGHVLFFYRRLGYLADRYDALVREMQARGYKPNFTASLREVHADIPADCWGDWRPDAEALALNRARIKERGG